MAKKSRSVRSYLAKQTQCTIWKVVKVTTLRPVPNPYDPINGATACLHRCVLLRTPFPNLDEIIAASRDKLSLCSLELGAADTKLPAAFAGAQLTAFTPIPCAGKIFVAPVVVGKLEDADVTIRARRKQVNNHTRAETMKRC